MKIIRTIPALIVLSAAVFGQSGGTFNILQSVVASGGGQTGGGQITIVGTIGQTAAGTNPGSGAFVVRSGFWTPQIAPTAAAVSVGGRITTADGRGIRNAAILLTNTADGTSRSARSSSFGYYRFEDVAVGETYILSVVSKRFVFLPDMQVITLLDELADANFTAQPE